MTNRKSTKRALLGSVVAMVLCLAMLVGATFAWFTDTASTGVNKIQAGKLDVALEMKDASGNWVSAEGKTLDFVKAADAKGEAILWEPGCTYTLPELRVVNNGNLALKYKVIITGIQGSAKLNEAIEWTIGDVAMGAEQHLAAGESNAFTIKGHMKESAGNEYMNESIDGIAITVVATQDTVESDSFGTQYDKDATYLTYPAGVTDEIFDSKTDADYSIPGGSTGKAQAVAAYVDSNGEVQYTADIKTALDNGASTIYLKKNTKGRLMALTDFLAQPNRSSDVTKDITIYANGADFEYGELAINTSDAGKNANFTIKVYDAKNLRVWGNTPNAGVTQNIILENCTYEGTGIGTNAAGGILDRKSVV